MSRAGRKRKPDISRKHGRVDWRALAEDPTLVAKWHRARDNILAFGGDQFLASQAGKMFVFRQLTALEVEAAKRWSEMIRDNDQLIYSMARTPRGASLERVQPGMGYDPPPEIIQRFQDRFNAAQEAILRAGQPALTALNRLCCEEAASSVLPEARKGLAQLIIHFHLQSPNQAP